MKVVTYLAFTILSIVINFAVMDYINEKTRYDNQTRIGFNASSAKRRFNDALKRHDQEAHAVYYQTNIKMQRNIASSTKTYNNSTFEPSTEIPSTITDFFYDENSSVTEDTLTTVTESPTTTEFENVTEITLFGVKNTSTVKPKTVPQKSFSTNCSCNFLYNACDVNCCCDSDCTKDERKLFMCVEGKSSQNEDSCVSLISSFLGTGLDSLFCVVKTNLPDKRRINKPEHDVLAVSKAFKWHSSDKPSIAPLFSRLPYNTGDPVWVLKNSLLYYIDIPALNVNNYCTSRKVMKFMSNEKISCNVKLTDLEMFHVLNTINESLIISAIEKTSNTTSLNCSTTYCTKWRVVICNESICESYNRSLHEPICTDSICTNIAQRVDYTFHYHEKKITNATVTLFAQKISPNVPFINQEINVRFAVGNISLDKVIELSGNPGYIQSRPVIVSYAKSNHTNGFFNSTVKNEKYLQYPINKNGLCIVTNVSENFILFGLNGKTKCRHNVRQNKIRNGTDLCKSIQNSISEILGLHKQAVACPYGNPQNVKDEKWIPLKRQEIESEMHGNFNKQQNTLHCYNLITAVSYIFTFADVSELDTKRENKILSAQIGLSVRNVTFDLDEMSTVISVDTMFIDETKTSAYEYAGGPQINIHLPNDFFFPFSLNKCCVLNSFSKPMLVASVFLVLRA